MEQKKNVRGKYDNKSKCKNKNDHYVGPDYADRYFGSSTVNF